MPNEGENMKETPQQPEQGNEISRRDVLKGALGVGAVATGLSQATEVKAFDGGDGTEVEEQPFGEALRTNFSEMSALGNREGMIEAVKNNIEVFKNAESDNLLSVGEPTGSQVEIIGYGSVRAPIINFDMTNPQNHTGFFLSKPGDSKAAFPNIGNSLFRNGTETDEKIYSNCMQGINLGRTEHTFNSVNGISYIVDIGYFGQYFGDKEQGSKLNKVVMPIWLGFRTPDGTIAVDSGVKVKSVDSGPNQSPPHGSSSEELDNLVETLKSFDQNIGNSVTEMLTNVPQPLPPNIQEMIAPLQWPPEFFERAYVDQQDMTTLNIATAIQNITLIRANRDGYVLNSPQEQSSVEVPISNMFDVEANSSVNDQIKLLPNPSDFMNKDLVTTEDTVKLPRYRDGVIAPTSSSIA